LLGFHARCIYTIFAPVNFGGGAPNSMSMMRLDFVG